MKKFVLVLVGVFAFSFSTNAYGDMLTLTNTKTLPEFPTNIGKQLDWEICKAADTPKVLDVRWRWKDATGNPIGDYQVFNCVNHKDEGGTQLNNADCTAKDEPYGCCTGLDLGICECFNDVFVAPAPDTTTPVGKVVKDRLKTQWLRENDPTNSFQ